MIFFRGFGSTRPKAEHISAAYQVLAEENDDEIYVGAMKGGLTRQYCTRFPHSETSHDHRHPLNDPAEGQPSHQHPHCYLEIGHGDRRDSLAADQEERYSSPLLVNHLGLFPAKMGAIRLGGDLFYPLLGRGPNGCRRGPMRFVTVELPVCMIFGVEDRNRPTHELPFYQVKDHNLFPLYRAPSCMHRVF